VSKFELSEWLKELGDLVSIFFVVVLTDRKTDEQNSVDFSSLESSANLSMQSWRISVKWTLKESKI
jgi:hypothetical protein